MNRPNRQTKSSLSNVFRGRPRPPMKSFIRKFLVHLELECTSRVTDDVVRNYSTACPIYLPQFHTSSFYIVEFDEQCPKERRLR